MNYFNTANYQLILKKVDDIFNKLNIEKRQPIDLYDITKKLNIKILEKSLDDNISGFLFINQNEQPIIGINEKHPTTRQRFTIAHEIGHYILHAPKDENISFVDKQFFIANRNKKSNQGIFIEEIEANFFAAELLMPSEAIYKSFVKEVDHKNISSTYKKLSKVFDVSEQAMKFRLSNLGFIEL